MDHIPPPPPYSETDPGTAILTPATSQTDNASLPPAPSAASSADSVIFTPPYTPTESGQHSRDTDLDHVSSNAAAEFFESRPAIGRPSPIPRIYTITITSTSTPRDIPYPADPPLNDVTEQDWATFVNYLFPDHAADVNGEIVDRKLEAEMASLRLESEGRPPTDMAQVEAQLEPLRRTPQAAERLAERLEKIDTTITEWNRGFFEPRSVQIRFIEPEIRFEEAETRAIPGAWIPSDHEILENPEGGEPRETRRGFSFRPFGGIEASARGIKIGPIRADTDGFRIGTNGFVADGRGLRLGNMFIADGNGVSIGGRVFGRRDDRDKDRSFEDRRRGRRGHHGPHGHHGRGRAYGHGRHHRGRSSSTSSSGSSSSSSSSDSDSSVGSLPEFDDLKDQQLPIARQSLLDWMNHPDQPITRKTVRNIKEEIKAAKKSNPRQFDQDVKALRSDVRNLMKEFKDAKRAQKIHRRQLRKEKRTVRRLAKKERRAARKEERRRRKGKDKEEAHVSGGFPAVPGVGHMNHLTAMHSMQAIPNMPISSGARGPFGAEGPFGGRGPFGRGGPRAKVPSFGRTASGAPGMPGMAAMHGAWPFTRGLSTPGCPTSGLMGGPISHSASNIHQQARDLDAEAACEEADALRLRAASTGKQVGEKEKLKKFDQAAKLQEEAEQYRREAERLRSEAVHLDGELARDFEEDQASGVIHH
ncbi:hy [Hyphodiscus hymeniophilus]|uniref:Hy n=1 Tax=Hyphodiscus hymeniophilus TaxID=353542 RepID=A0A9P7B075_9HELO|nr:hy [Hyphodiscus hymeniophilus]